jgi:hypothetical protein
MLRALKDGPRATFQVQEDKERRAEEARKQAEDARRWAELENQLEDAKHRIRELEAGRNGQSSCSDIPRTT